MIPRLRTRARYVYTSAARTSLLRLADSPPKVVHFPKFIAHPAITISHADSSIELLRKQPPRVAYRATAPSESKATRMLPSQPLHHSVAKEISTPSPI